MRLINDDVLGEFYNFLLSDTYCEFYSFANKILPQQTIQSFLQQAFHSKLLQMWERVLIVELNLAERDGLLVGETPEARFDFFVSKIQELDNFSELVEKYPVLWANWQRELKIYSGALKLTVDRIINDLQDAAFLLYQTNVIEKITDIACLGDMHNGMQRAARVNFSADGKEHTIFLKPRNLAIDEGFSRFIAWWNSIGPIDQKVPRVINRNGYGWAEAINYDVCQSAQETAKYYYRYGSLIALTYMFAATDLHMENLVAAGAYPVIVDIETLFSCTLETEKHLSSNYHLYSSLLLPVHIVHKDVEISPLSGRGGLQTDVNVLVNPQKRDSSLKFQSQKLKMAPSNNHVLMNGKQIDFLSYKDEIALGLKETLTFLLLHKKQVIVQLDSFMRNAQVRIVMYATEEYAKILHNIYHPNCLRNNKTARNILALTGADRDSSIQQAEIDDLQRGDIPYFQIEYGSSVLMTAGNNPVGVDIHHSPRQKMIYQFNRLNAELIEETIADLEHAFLIYNVRRGKAHSLGGNRYTELSHVLDVDWMDELAKNVLTKIMGQAVLVENSYSWRTMALNPDNTVAPDLTPTDLYQGLTGVALAFHIVGKKLKETAFQSFAEKLSDQIIRTLDLQTTAQLGALAGTAGTLWALSVMNREHLPHLLPTLESSISRLALRLVSEQFDKFQSLDYMNGAAGTLSMLLRCHALFRDYPIADKLQKLIDFTFCLIKENSEKLASERDTYLGFAHGTAGVSACLAEYMTYMGRADAQAQTIIVNNTMRENHYKTENSWPRKKQDSSCDTSWCHGSVGIGISRLHCRPYLPSALVEADLASVETRLGEPKKSLCACHGLLGDYYFARMAGLSEKLILQKIRAETEQFGIRTDLNLNGLEMIGAVNGVTSLFVGDAIFANNV
ncbi:type 2 lanthipeptide synthetase LanM [Ochrobactrum sp. GPK 3]